jgi:predicted nuclease with TOPRIM domain
MKEQLEKRLQTLTTEYEAGQKALANLEAQKASLRETLLRISGAIQVLEEELAIAKNQENNHRNQPSPSTIETISET